MLTVVILTKNSSDTIEKCLESVKWCKDIVIVDSFSTDNTLEICKKFTDKIYQNTFTGYGDQLNWAFRKIESEWVLVVDSDEKLSQELQDEIKNLIDKQKSPSLDGYYISRKSKFLGRWIYHSGWYPDYVLRLFRKDKTYYKKRKLGSSAIVEGKTGYLKGKLLHYPYRDLAHYLQKFSRYTLFSAEQMYDEGEKANIFGITFKPILRFIRDYIFRGGFLDGKQGFIICVLSSYYVFMRYARLWEIQQKSKLKNNKKEGN